MCTVAIRRTAAAVTLLAVRDEFLDRGTDCEAAWWPEIAAAVVGARDQQAHGAAVAVDLDAQRLAVLVNADGQPVNSALLHDSPTSRGAVAVRAAAGQPSTIDLVRAMPGFHLLTVTAGDTSLTSWDGSGLIRSQVGFGDHVLTWTGLDQSGHPRGRSTSAALSRLHPDASPSPASWREVLEAAVVIPRQSHNRIYGTVSATLVTWDARGLRRFVSINPLKMSTWTPGVVERRASLATGSREASQ